ncbi:Sua5/YciO/YrdC/YwlC family protein [Candidatus Woesearchaeota archaeon]|nr:Sua5/YciO/YrdC/YwlC family protein [Candidatus Woesearchaeota archaeon]
MRILTKEECEIENGYISEKISRGTIFIHPTDTIYGLGCNALRAEAVKKIRDIKESYENPFSVIAPSKEWILENCHVNDKGMGWLNKLPGPLTLIFKLKNMDCISKDVNNGLDTLGVRIPDNWFSEFIKWLDVPIITTSVNKTKNEFMTSVEDLDGSIKGSVDFIVYDGEKKGSPSKIVNLTKGMVVETPRNSN